MQVLKKLENIADYNEEVMYLRKVNQVHGWFVRNCESIYEDVRIKVTYQNLKDLLRDIDEVLENTVLVNGEIVESYTYDEDGNKVENKGEGRVIKDTSKARELLPTTEGFFFGSYEYDEWYVEGLKRCKEQLENIIETSDEYDEFEYYASY